MLFELMLASITHMGAKINKATTVVAEEPLEAVSPFEEQDVNWERRSIAVDGTIIVHK
jgi:hypothetical protein